MFYEGLYGVNRIENNGHRLQNKGKKNRIKGKNRK